MPHKDWATRKAWLDANPEKKLRYSRNAEAKRKHRPSRQDQVNAACKRWRDNYPERNVLRAHRYKVRKRGNGGSFTVEQFKSLGNRCLGCGLTEEALVSVGRMLVPDHVISVADGGSNDISNIQPLCQGKGGCNNRKGRRHIDYRVCQGDIIAPRDSTTPCN